MNPDITNLTQAELLMQAIDELRALMITLETLAALQDDVDSTSMCK